jgi:myosin heavy subunit
MKSVIPWALAALLAAATVLLYFTNNAKDVELQKWTQQGPEMARLKAESDQASAVPGLTAEIAKFKNEHEELLSLRNEVQQLRTQNKQLAVQLDAAKTASANASQAVHETQQQLAQMAAEKEALSKVAQIQTSAQQQAAACINNLRQIEVAKHRWAMENGKSPELVPSMADLAPYLPKNFQESFTCPSGGGYNINAVNAVATCTIPGHVLPQ